MIEPGQIVESYHIGALLAEGATSRVFEAVSASGEPVALKVLKAQAPGDMEAKRFEREAHLGRVLVHAGLARMIHHGPGWIAFERLGPGLSDTAVRRAHVGPRPIASLLAQLAGILAFLHSRGVVHRDVKPSHVLFRDAATAVLADLGIAGLMADDPLEGSEIVGSPGWMAPEQAAGAPPAPPADVWSLCAVGAWLLSGRALFSGAADTVLRDRQAGLLPRFDDAGVPAEASSLAALRKAGLAVEPSQRPTLRDITNFARTPFEMG